MKDVHPILLELSFCQMLWANCNAHRQRAVSILQQNNKDIQANSIKRRTEETMAELDKTIKTLEPIAMEYLRSTYGLKLPFYSELVKAD